MRLFNKWYNFLFGIRRISTSVHFSLPVHGLLKLIRLKFQLKLPTRLLPQKSTTKCYMASIPIPKSKSDPELSDEDGFEPSTRPKTWPAKPTLYLIKLLKSYKEPLFSTETGSAHDNIKAAIWDNITGWMNASGCLYSDALNELTVQQCKKIYENMRMAFTNSTKKQKKCVTLPNGKRKFIAKPAWPFYKKFQPLMKYITSIEEEQVKRTVVLSDSDGSDGDEDHAIGLNDNCNGKDEDQADQEPIDVDEDISEKSEVDAEAVDNSERPEKLNPSATLSKLDLSARPHATEVNSPMPFIGPASKKRLLQLSNGGSSSSSSPTEQILVEEMQGIRQEIRGVNRNLEKMVDVHNRLNDNIERFLTAIRLRF